MTALRTDRCPHCDSYEDPGVGYGPLACPECGLYHRLAERAAPLGPDGLPVANALASDHVKFKVSKFVAGEADGSNVSNPDPALDGEPEEYSRTLRHELNRIRHKGGTIFLNARDLLELAEWAEAVAIGLGQSGNPSGARALSNTAEKAKQAARDLRATATPPKVREAPDPPPPAKAAARAEDQPGIEVATDEETDASNGTDIAEEFGQDLVDKAARALRVGPRASSVPKTTKPGSSPEKEEEAQMATTVTRKSGSKAGKATTKAKAAKAEPAAAKETTAPAKARRTAEDVDKLVPKFVAHLSKGGKMKELKEEYSFSDDGPIRAALYRGGYDSKGNEHGEEAESIKPKTAAGKKMVLALRNEGAGWYRLAFLTGMTEPEVKAFVADNGGPTGRVYREPAEKPAPKAEKAAKDPAAKAKTGAKTGVKRGSAKKAAAPDPS